MRRFISLLFVVVAMLLLSTSLVGAESPIVFNSKSGCGPESPGNGKGKAKGRDKNCTNETNQTNETKFKSESKGIDRTTSTAPNWSTFPTATRFPTSNSFPSQINIAPDCVLERGRGHVRGSLNNCQSAATTVTEVEKDPISLTIAVPCAGELVRLFGQVNLVSHQTYDGNGGFHVKVHTNPMGVRGFGLTSGTPYRGTGVTQWVQNVKVGEQYTFINNFRIIGRGSGNNFMLHQTIHYTINANGELTVDFSKISTSCK